MQRRSTDPWSKPPRISNNQLIWLLIAATAMMFAAIFWGGCAPTIPYSTERTVMKGRLGPTKTLTVHNPTDKAYDVLVACEGDIGDGETSRWFRLRPYESKSILFVAVDYRENSEACWVDRWLPCEY